MESVLGPALPQLNASDSHGPIKAPWLPLRAGHHSPAVPTPRPPLLAYLFFVSHTSHSPVLSVHWSTDTFAPFIP